MLKGQMGGPSPGPSSAPTTAFRVDGAEDNDTAYSETIQVSVVGSSGTGSSSLDATDGVGTIEFTDEEDAPYFGRWTRPRLLSCL